MRSTLLCVFFILIIQRKEARGQANDFRPTPIPLNEWHHDRRDSRAGTLHETFATASPPSVAAVPAHYWEDALRHSVYLSLVRDKIDQLIAKGDVISPNSKPEGYDSKEIDDHDLWDKIKTAPFDRIKEEEPATFGDVTIMAKGRLLERNGGFLFAEDERTKEKCNHDNCMQDVKAFWSVKRVRQRDQETSPGKYHYELTFSVISQTPKKQKKPYENPIRTFTVKESSPAAIYERPQEYRRPPSAQSHVPRPERAIWVHKNIASSKFVGRKQYTSGLDRIFSSLFSDDDDQSYESPNANKYKQSPYPPPSVSQYSKIGHVGIPVDHHQQIPYPYRQGVTSVKHIRPPLQAPPTNQNIHHYQDISATTANSIPYGQYPYDHRLESSQSVKTTRPAVLPTPLPPIISSFDQSSETMNAMSIENTNNTFRPEVMRFHKTYNKHKNLPTKVNYFSDHVRPPIYNAPPGVFVTMDKKPFKPMPPMKLANSKLHKTNKPIDFRPSPQITDQSTDQDFFGETDFRPMAINFSDNLSTESYEDNYPSKKIENKIRKQSTIGKKPPKKHDNVKGYSHTTAFPDIITAQSTSEEDIESLAWANILGSFSKTTPMESQTEKVFTLDTTTPMTTSTIATSTTVKKSPITSISPVQHTDTTILKPKRRTRPPPKVVKQEKIKKHKRITTTTSTTTPESTLKRRPSIDLTPQASSTPSGNSKPKLTSTSTTSTTTTTTTTTTTKPTTTKTTTTQSPTTTTSTKPPTSTTQSRSKNRFRQSTLIIKGTSVKHDRWNTNALQKNQTNNTTSVSSSFLHRRKGSNFQGYISSTTPKIVNEDKEHIRESHADHKLSTSNPETTPKNVETTTRTSNSEKIVDQYQENGVLPLEKSPNTKESDLEESKDHSEYIFQTTIATDVKSEEYTTPKSKSKCKKKKQMTASTEDSTDADLEIATASALTATYATTANSKDITTTESNILQDLLNYSFSDEKSSKTELQQEESAHHESYLKIDDDIEDFLGVLQGKTKQNESEDEYTNDDEDDDDEGDDDDDEQENGREFDDTAEEDNSSEEEDYEESKIPSIDDDIDFNSDEDKRKSSRGINYDSEKKDRPYSFLELMAMS